MTALHELHEFARRGVDAQAAVDQAIAGSEKLQPVTTEALLEERARLLQRLVDLNEEKSWLKRQLRAAEVLMESAEPDHDTSEDFEI